MMSLSPEKTAYDSLQRSLVFLREADSNPLGLKWFIIALHHALHGFMLCALAGSAQEGIWKEPIQYQELNGLKIIDVWHKKSRLLRFLDAYKRIKDIKEMGKYTFSKPFVAEDKHDKAMEFLNDQLRNEMIHYRPVIYGMDLPYIAHCAPVLDVLDFLIFEAATLVQLRVTEDQIRGLLGELKTRLVAST